MVRALESVANKAETSNESFVTVFTTLVLSTISQHVVQEQEQEQEQEQDRNGSKHDFIDSIQQNAFKK